MRVFTWNVLHRVHGEGHGEEAIRHWPDEGKRLRGVVELISRLMTECEVGLLQEVSGDVLLALREALPGHAVLEHLYPRVPRAKNGSTSVKDVREYLVVVAPVGSHVMRAQTAANDQGKGLLAVNVGGTTVVSTHVSWGDQRAVQLAALRAVTVELPEPVVVGGDFNVEREVVEQALECSAVPLPADSLATREAWGRKANIDHVLARGATLSDARVVEHQGLSDHRPVVANVLPLPATAGRGGAKRR